MASQTFGRRFLSPVIVVFITMTLSYYGYFGARHIEHDMLHQFMAVVFGTTYFLSIAFGTLYVFTVGYIRGASLIECFLASWINPFIWMTKEVYGLTESHPLAESLYWYVNPLNLWLVSFMVMEMGIAVLMAKRMIRKTGGEIRGGKAIPVMVISGSFITAISLFAWGEGENVYGMFLNGYRSLFGAGV